MSSLLVISVWSGVAILWVLNLVRNRIWSTTQLNSLNPSPPSHFTVCLLWEGGGEVREKVEGQLFTRGVENTNMTDYFSSL